MQWSSISDHNNRSDEVKSEEIVKEFKPRIFSLNKSEANAMHLAEKKLGSDFVMSDVVKKVSGIEAIEKKNEQDVVDRRVDEKMTDLKNHAYVEAYQIGLQDGFKSAVDQRLKDINQAIDDFQVLVNSIHTIKTDLIYQNEAHIVSTIFRIAEKIAYGHIAENPDSILPVIRQSIELAQADDEVTVLVSPEQIDFIENLKKLSGRDFDFLKNIRLEPSDKVMSGGCIVETNYGVIDAQVQTRVEKIWTELSQALPKIKKI
ncbi:MAG: flagellar assembly protein, partial [Bdellovibrionaceae bacterium]|nr:flagellar assembly protein [Pseudobdellovibrionaceae bacterium]